MMARPKMKNLLWVGSWIVNVSCPSLHTIHVSFKILAPFDLTRRQLSWHRQTWIRFGWGVMEDKKKSRASSFCLWIDLFVLRDWIGGQKKARSCSKSSLKKRNDWLCLSSLTWRRKTLWKSTPEMSILSSFLALFFRANSFRPAILVFI